MDAEQFQKAIGTRERNMHSLSAQETAEYVGLILSEIETFGDAASSRFHYLWKAWNETDNIPITEDICMLLGLIAEYASFKGYTLSEMMTKAIHLRNQRNNDMSGVN